jgi:tRNA threonylcarbamoyl adenosine modification protein (Sua5/YciO/YrdC/YwlC family)
MAQFFHIHPDDPQPRLIRQAAEIVRGGGVIVYPTDSTYALGCHIGDKRAIGTIRSIRKVSEQHHLTLVCRDLSEISTYARVENAPYRFIKALTPGPYTFLLKATHEVPRRLQHPRRKTIGIRVPGNVIAQRILQELGEPLISSTLQMPDEEMPMTDPYEIHERLGNQVDLVVDGGYCGFEPTTVVDMIEEPPAVIRVGKGSLDVLSL